MIYDAYANTGTLEKYVQKIKMIPLEEDGSNQGSENNYWEIQLLVCLGNE